MSQEGSDEGSTAKGLHGAQSGGYGWHYCWGYGWHYCWYKIRVSTASLHTQKKAAKTQSLFHFYFISTHIPLFKKLSLGAVCRDSSGPLFWFPSCPCPRLLPLGAPPPVDPRPLSTSSTAASYLPGGSSRLEPQPQGTLRATLGPQVPPRKDGRDGKRGSDYL